MTEENSVNKSLFSVFAVVAYTFIGVNVLDVTAQIATGFASSQQLSATGQSATFSQQVEYAARQVASPFAILAAMIGLLVLTAIRYMQADDEEVSQGWFIAIAGSALSAVVVVAAALYDLIKMFGHNNPFGDSDAGKFAYTLEWLAAIILGGTVIFAAVRLWNNTMGGGTYLEDEDEEAGESSTADETKTAEVKSDESGDEDTPEETPTLES